MHSSTQGPLHRGDRYGGCGEIPFSSVRNVGRSAELGREAPARDSGRSHVERICQSVGSGTLEIELAVKLR